MNAKQIESGFGQMGARFKIRELPTRQITVPVWMRRNLAQPDYAMDIRRDQHGAFFELRVPRNLNDSLEVTVAQAEPKSRHLLLFVRKNGDKPQLDRFLCGHDEREWFVAAVPGGAS